MRAASLNKRKIGSSISKNATCSGFGETKTEQAAFWIKNAPEFSLIRFSRFANPNKRKIVAKERAFFHLFGSTIAGKTKTRLLPRPSRSRLCQSPWRRADLRGVCQRLVPVTHPSVSAPPSPRHTRVCQRPRPRDTHIATPLRLHVHVFVYYGVSQKHGIRSIREATCRML